ncbi:MAG: hypothetical protein K2J71_01655 [Oscillospiraceae bacterium]|nr:hypothetical protein [Oscillospiraceae bacterium]
MAEFELHPEILQTAAGSIPEDIAQIQTAVYGREVRASIAECLYLLQQSYEQSASELAEIQTELADLKNMVNQLETALESYQQEITQRLDNAENMLESCSQSLEDYKQETDQRLETAENVLESCTQDLHDVTSRTDVITEILESVLEPEELNKVAGYPDLDGDGRVSASDVSMILAASAQGGSGGDSGLTEEQETLADLNGDGVINAEDASLISEFSTALGVGLYQNTAIGWMKFKKDKGI